MAMREAQPGAMKLPKGSKDKDKIAELEQRIIALEKVIFKNQKGK